jgi:hypothetical protein
MDAAHRFGEACLPELGSLCLRHEVDSFFTVINFWMDATSGVALEVKTSVPTYRVEDEEGRTHPLIHLTIEEKGADLWCLWRPDPAGFDSRSIFEGALIEK